MGVLREFWLLFLADRTTTQKISGWLYIVNCVCNPTPPRQNHDLIIKYGYGMITSNKDTFAEAEKKKLMNTFND